MGKGEMVGKGEKMGRKKRKLTLAGSSGRKDTRGKNSLGRRGRAWKEAGWREELKGVKRPWEREGKQERTMERGRRAVSPSQD